MRSSDTPLATALAGLLALVSCGAEPAPGVTEATEDALADVPRERRWRPVRPRTVDEDLSPEQRAEIEALRAIGYSEGVEAPSADTGVTAHDRARAWPGMNLYVSGHGPEVILMDMEGERRHTWRCSPEEVWPGARDDGTSGTYIRRARLLAGGDVLAIVRGLGVVKLDRDSRVLWAHAGSAHHDLDVDADGQVVVLEREPVVVPWLHEERSILDDVLVWLDPEGQVLRRLSLLSCIERSELRAELVDQLRRKYERDLVKDAWGREAFADAIAANPEAAAEFNPAGDVFHSNTVQVLDGSASELSPHFAAGNLLVSIRELDRVVVLDPRSERLVWSLQGSWRRQHEPVLLDTGTMILFDNLGPAERGEPGFSEILELDPRNGEVLWSYRAGEPGQFDCPFNGTCQRLANGNTLVTESTHGRAFEVNVGGRIVWEFISPHRAGLEDEFVALLPDLTRIPEAFVADWLER